MPQSETGRIRLFYDFFGEDALANTAETRALGPFVVGGQGSAETDAGVHTISGALSGAGRITTTNEVDHTTLVGTNIAFDVGLMGTIVAEARVQFNNLDTKEAFFGFTDIDPDTLSLQTDVLTGSSTTLTLTASDICGFYLSSELTDHEDWHTVYVGGTAGSVTDATALDVNDDAVAGEWQVLRLELAPDGLVRWYIDEVLVRTVAGAVSTSTDLALVLGVEAKGANIEEMDVDYLLVTANRDWTV